MAWYIADYDKPYLVKASASVDFGYKILITDMEQSYFCAADKTTITNEKKVSMDSCQDIGTNKHMLLEIQSNN